jgi:hypothetical protein
MKENPQTNQQQYPKGHFVSKWIGIGMGVFTIVAFPILIAIDRVDLIALGPAFGMSIGLPIGAMIEKKHEKLGNIRPLNEKEVKKKKIGLFFGLAILIIGVVLGVYFYMQS